jgi:hypothetical protein
MMTRLFHFAEVDARVLLFASPYDMSPFPLGDVSLACFLLTRGFVLRLDAYAPVDLWALAV